ncbi:HK97 family phage prohead protease [Streptomyces sp. TRM66268-LWL]|uniref:HK97 family phage prohead protease n=1 Tax=Streptomyces polyasparticus TaxID=2767826 RepID=A0ABR7SGH3_9ACTN|nr:HK97 family phage prohead protease [Streptomyces polyasparticus]MBC9714498.1 HK97 family phage prohead protease [Streptomyces polyasparticus]
MTETRSLTSPAEIRAKGDGFTMRGYAYRFNELSHDLGGFRERITPGAGMASLERNDVVATFNHNVDQVLGRRSSGTLRVGEDEHGGWYEIDLPDTSTGRDLAELLKRGDVKGSSFTFRVGRGGQRRAGSDPETGLPVREITEMDVAEVGPVLTPAYPTTDAALRSIEAVLGVALRSAKADDEDPKESEEDTPDESQESTDEPAGGPDEPNPDEPAEDEPDEHKNARALFRALIITGGNTDGCNDPEREL